MGQGVGAADLQPHLPDVPPARRLSTRSRVGQTAARERLTQDRIRLQEVKATAALGRGKDALALAIEAAFPTTAGRGRTTPVTSCGKPGATAQPPKRGPRSVSTPSAVAARTRHERTGARVTRVLQALEHWADARVSMPGCSPDSTTVEHLGALGVLLRALVERRKPTASARASSPTCGRTRSASSVWAARIAAVKVSEPLASIHQALRDGYARLYSLHRSGPRITAWLRHFRRSFGRGSVK